MSITLRSISKSFPVKQSNNYVPVVDNVTFDIPDGKVVALFGPNGCGKTTILNIIAGIEKPDSGKVIVNGEGHSRPATGYAFQNFRDVLLPWESALDNVTFGLRAMGVAPSDALQRTLSFLDTHHLSFPRENYPYQLSIGQQQTVSLIRTLIQRPANILLDEPFAALDHKARFRMQDILISVSEEIPTAIVLVSHDIDEAIYLSDELLLLSKRPAHVARRFVIPFERPRQHDLLVSAEFAELRREMLAAFISEVET